MTPSDCMLTPKKGSAPETGCGAFSHAPEDTLARHVTATMANQCLQLLNLPTANPATIRKWAERGKIRRYGRDQFGLMQYDLDDIVRVASGHTLEPA